MGMECSMEERYYSRSWREIAVELTQEIEPERIQELTEELLRAFALPPFKKPMQTAKLILR